MPIELWICRTGEAKDYGSSNQCASRQCGLSDIGRLQAQKLAERIGSVDFEAIYSSDVRSAVETTRILQAHGVTARSCCQGASPSDVTYDGLLRDKKHQGESWETVAIRTRRKLSKEDRDSSSQDKSAASKASELWKNLKGWGGSKVRSLTGGASAGDADRKRARRILIITHGETIAEMINAHIPAARAHHSLPHCSVTVLRVVPCSPPKTSKVDAVAASFSASLARSGGTSPKMAPASPKMAPASPVLTFGRAASSPSASSDGGPGSGPGRTLLATDLSRVQFILVRSADDSDAEPGATASYEWTEEDEKELWDEAEIG